MSIRRATVEDAAWIGALIDADIVLRERQAGRELPPPTLVGDIEHTIAEPAAESWVDDKNRTWAHLIYLPDSPYGEAIQVAWLLPGKEEGTSRRELMQPLLVRAIVEATDRIPRDKEIPVYARLDDEETLLYWADFVSQFPGDVYVMLDVRVLWTLLRPARARTEALRRAFQPVWDAEEVSSGP